MLNFKFINCGNGTQALVTCPGGLLYNAALKMCDWYVYFCYFLYEKQNYFNFKFN